MPASRAAAPGPISFDKPGAYRQDSFGSVSSGKGKELTRSSSWFKRSNTSSSTSSSTSSDGGSKPTSPSVNVYTHCGRHTDQYLFGGHSFRELFRRKSQE
ncbi:hypothetical protein F5Y17DRAFT_43564 [Xylariaceae sp. FL0594]|nr:hypothetical protein F5Y17DRAFT_43564 [Xylariaceae sp. FL0594]